MDKSNVLFLCTGNSARSQMAEGILRKLAGARFNVFSAGLEPKGVNPFAVKVLDEIGIDASNFQSEDVKEYLGRLPVRFLIIVCENAEKRCPTTWPGMLQRLFWSFDDPAAYEGTYEERVEEFRRVRDEIVAKISAWLKSVENS